MSARALRTAVRNRLRTELGLDDESCEITIDGKPTPMAGQRFTAVHPGPWSNSGNENLDEHVGVSITVTDRLPVYPVDRFGAEELDKAMTGLETFAEGIVAVMDNGQYELLNAANTLILDGTNTFVEPLRFRDGETPVIRGGDWFGADPEEPLAGLSLTLRFAEARRIRRFEDLNVEVYDNRNLPYSELPIVEPPSVFKAALFTWFDQYEAIRLANVPRDRETTYYFAQAGNDSTGDGSESSPWQSLPKAQAVIDAAPAVANLRLRFNRGDVWRGTDVLAVTKSHVTIDDYGDTNLDKPTFTRFDSAFPASPAGWTNSAGDRWTRTHGEVGAHWLRDADDPLYPYIEQTSTAGVEATPRSFYYVVGSGVVHVNAGVGVNPNTKNLELAPMDLAGWQSTKDNVRFENIILHGVGMHPNTTSSYGLYLFHSDDAIFEEVVCVGVEVYYAGYHAIGHIVAVKPTRAASATLIDCKAGYCCDRFTAGTHGMTVYVSFANYGDHELYMRACEVTGGMLPSSSWGATATSRKDYGIFQHTDSGAYVPALSICIGTAFPDNPWQCLSTTYIYGPTYTSVEATELRAYVVDERPEADGLGLAIGFGIRDRCMINCAYTFTGAYKPSGGSPGALWIMNTVTDDMDGLAINCKVTADFTSTTNFGAGWGFYSGVTEALNMRLHNCRFDGYGINNSVQYVQIVGWNTATMGPRIKFTNCIVTLDAIVGFTQYGGYMGAGARDAEVGDNDEILKVGAGRATNNAYWLEQGPANVGGIDPNYFDGDPDPVIATALIPDTSPSVSSALYHAGTANGLEYDFERNLRNLAAPHIGPLEG